TASTSFNRVAMSEPLSQEIGDRLRFGRVALVAILLDQFGIDRRQPREADHPPRGFVAVAAVDRIGEEALHGDLQKRFEERPAVEVLERSLTLLQRLERILALRGCEPVEVLAVDFAGPGVGSDDASGEELSRRERELIAVFRFRFAERPIAVHFGAAAPGAGELSIDESDNSAIRTGWSELVGRN